MQTRSGGIRRLYRHVEILSNHGIQASILHTSRGFCIPDMPEVTIRYLEAPGTLHSNDIIVIPEGFPNIMYKLKDKPLRRFVIALNWSYIFKTLPDSFDWRHCNIERVLVVCPFIGKLVSWSMNLPVHNIAFSVDPRLYFHKPEIKQKMIVYIGRKNQQAPMLKRILAARNPDFTRKIKWQSLNNLSEEEYASQVRKSSVFLNLSTAEGLVNSCLEAMNTGSIVVGFNSVGGEDMLRGKGPEQNCILAQNGDYATLAYRMERLLSDLLADSMNRWGPLIKNAKKLTTSHTPESEKQSILSFWDQFLNKTDFPPSEVRQSYATSGQNSTCTLEASLIS